MSTKITQLVLAAFLMAAIIVAPAEARKPQSPFEQHIAHLRKKVDKKFGPNVAGRRIIEQGPRGGGRPSMKLKVRYRDHLKRMLHPPVVKPVLVAPQPAGSSASSYGAAPQSSGSTYCGAYQFDQQTWNSVGGSGTACGASPEEQDRRAQMLLQQRGTSPWPNCGSTNLAAIRQCENSGRY